MRLTLLILLTSWITANAQICDPNTHALRFQDSAYVRFPSNSNLNISGDITVEAWIKASSFAPSYVQGSIVCKHGWSAGERGYVLRAGENGILCFAIAGVDVQGNAVGWKEVKSPPGNLQLNTWHHVAGTYDGHKLKLYIDGNSVGSVNFHGSINPSVDYDLKIGRIADENTFDKRFFNGWIDEVRIWNIALSANTIATQRNEQIDPNSANLVSYWRFNEGSGTTVNDIGGNGCNGTIIRANWDVDVPFTNGIPRPVITSVGNTLVSSSLTGNQWNLNGVPIPGETGITITPHTSGIYSVTTDFGLGCFATSDVYVIVIAGINEPGNFNYTLLNPSASVFQLTAGGRNMRNTFVRVYDINGRIAYENSNANDVIDLTTKPAGLYMLTVVSEGTEWRKKIFVN